MLRAYEGREPMSVQIARDAFRDFLVRRRPRVVVLKGNWGVAVYLWSVEVEVAVKSEVS